MLTLVSHVANCPQPFAAHTCW